MDIKRLIFFLLLVTGSASTAPLFMFAMESDIDSDVTALWENSIVQILKESAFEPVKIKQDYFAGCENVECAVSAARTAGASGLFRGRLRAEGKDSVNVRLHIDWLAGNANPQTDVQSVVPLAWDEVLKNGILLNLLSGITGKHAGIERTEEKRTIIEVGTNPENAVVMLNGNAVCQSPCQISDSGSVAQIAAYWHSGENLWAAKTTVKLGKDTAKVFLELRRSFAETQIRTNPENTMVFHPEVLSVKSKAIGKTPFTMQGLPGETQIRLFHKGYNDTLINVNIDAVEKQMLFVQLNPVTDQQKIYEQSLLVKSKNKRDIGLGLLGGSLGPLAAGVILCVLAQDDYKKAGDIKKELEQPSFGGKNFNAKVDENNRAVKSGDSKILFGAGLIGLSVVLAGIGFAVSF